MPIKTSPKAPRVKLEPNIKKVLAAICFLIAKGQKHGQNLTQYQIVKALFLADKKHLNTYGRPITFDNYHAMDHGPVPSLAYDLLKGTARVLQKYGLKSLPWTKRKGEGSSYLYTLTKTACSQDVLSPSDKEALTGALATIRALTFAQIRKLTHGDMAYLEAWGNEDGRRSTPMSLALLFDSPNPEAAETLAFTSRHL